MSKISKWSGLTCLLVIGCVADKRLRAVAAVSWHRYRHYLCGTCCSSWAVCCSSWAAWCSSWAACCCLWAVCCLSWAACCCLWTVCCSSKPPKHVQSVGVSDSDFIRHFLPCNASFPPMQRTFLSSSDAWGVLHLGLVFVSLTWQQASATPPTTWRPILVKWFVLWSRSLWARGVISGNGLLPTVWMKSIGFEAVENYFSVSDVFDLVSRYVFWIQRKLDLTNVIFL